MKLMNFANNHPEKFASSKIAFGIGFLQVSISFATEIVNLALLNSYKTVDKCIINFVTLGVVLDLTKFYYKALGDNKLKSVFDKTVKKTNKGAEI